jgi:atypical dual specificity phosphatase
MFGLLPDGVLSVWAKAVHWAKEGNIFTPERRREFNFDEITKHLFLGRQPRNQSDLAKMKEHGMKAIVTLNEDWELFVADERAFAEAGLDRLHLPTPDFQGPNQHAIHAAVGFIKKYVEDGKGVYVHCNAGKGRSALVVAAYLLHFSETKASTQEVVAAIKEKRPQISRYLSWYPLTGQARALHAYQQKLVKDDKRPPSRKKEL